jgi:hypothetical protein
MDEIYSLFITSILHFFSLSPSYHLPHVKCETTTCGGRVSGGGAQIESQCTYSQRGPKPCAVAWREREAEKAWAWCGVQGWHNRL